jgi:uncharacterized membrane protein YfcA
MTVTGPEMLALLGLGLGAGVLGALVGIGGGVVIVPALLLVFGFDVRIAVAISLLAVVGTSVAAGSLNQTGLANLRIGLSLELVTILGGIAGGLVATAIAPHLLGAALGVLLGVTAVLLLRGRDGEGQATEIEDVPSEDEASQEIGHLGGTYRDGHSGVAIAYEAERVPATSAIAFGAGALSGLLGVGGGFLKVPAMNMVMGLPLKVAAATSSFMVGITALASLFIYIARGYFYPYLAAPVVVGVLVGGISGARLQHRSSPRVLRLVLAAVLALVAVQLLLRAMGLAS